LAAAEIQIQIRELCQAHEPEGEARLKFGPVSFDITRGEFLSLVAPCPGGMAALLKTIAGVIPAAGGEIRVAGEKGRLHPGDVGLVLQRPGLLPWRSVLQNILLPAEMLGLDLPDNRNRARRLMAWFGLSGFDRCWPDDLPPGLDQSVSICRALVHSPPLLIMMEPFRMFDSLALEQILDSFQRLWMETGTTGLLGTTSIHEAVLLSDRVAVMSPPPERIIQIFSIDLPRPRRLDKAMTPAISEYCSRIRTVFRAQGVLP